MELLNHNDQLRILVTGNRGFVGSNLINRLKNKFRIVTLDQGKNKKIDILEKYQLDRIENIDVIIHLASKTSIPNSIINPYDTYITNMVGTLNILEFARQNNIGKIINLSTFVYGKPQYFPIDEKHPISPHSPYTKSKRIAEKLCQYYAEDYGIDIVTLRPFYLYGPSMNKTSFIPSVIKQISENGKVTLSNKNTKRDFLFIDDFVDLIDILLSNFPTGHRIFNVGFGESHSLEEIVELIKKILNIEADIEYSNSVRPNDIIDMVADTSSLRNLYGWKPVIEIDSGLRLTLSEMINKKL
jgi:UDP-glucose 4-epimerase